MTYFEVDVKIEVVDRKVSVLMKLESHELDLPRGRYGPSKMAVFCRSENQNSIEFDAPF